MARQIGSVKRLRIFKKCLYFGVLFLLFVLVFSSFAWAGWGFQVVDAIGDVGFGTSIALDASGYPHISYRDLSNENLKYARWTGSSWDIKTVAAGGVGASIALASNGYPRISYYVTDPHPDELKYARWTGSSWDIQVVDTANSIDGATSIALDASGYPHISYWDWGNENLKYAHWTGSSWDIKIVDSDFAGPSNSLALDGIGYPYISYFGGSSDDLRCAHWTGSSWDIKTVESLGSCVLQRGTSIGLDASDFPHISYFDATNDNLKYAKWTGSSWSIQTIDSAGRVGSENSIALDSNGYPHISYRDSTNEDLKYAKWTGSSWIIQIVDSSWGADPSIALDASDFPHISYCYYTGTLYDHDLKYAQWTATPTPFISSLSPISGSVGTLVTINGSNFGSIQGSSYVKFQYNKTASIYSWSNTQIKAYVPNGATSGNVTVTSGGGTSNGKYFTILQVILEVSRSSLDFGEIPKGEICLDHFTISNSGAGTLSGTIKTDMSWISVDPTSFDSNDVTVWVTVYTAPLEVWRTYTGTITIDSNGGQETVTVSIVPTCVKSYPNPYSPSSGKPLTFWGTGVPHATIKIYTLSGELVKTLKETKGENKITWDGRNEDGERIARGLYFFTTKNPREKNRGKFTVVR